MVDLRPSRGYGEDFSFDQILLVPYKTKYVSLI